MNPIRLVTTAIGPALADLAKMGIPDSFEARRFLLAIALQESGLSSRRQKDGSGAQNGPAVSFWQFEQGGGCKGVLTHGAVAHKMGLMCDDYNVGSTPAALWEAMRYHDIIAAAAARLLLYTLPSSIASTVDAGWAQYVSAWRPGKPRPETWAANWQLADLTIRS